MSLHMHKLKFTFSNNFNSTSAEGEQFLSIAFDGPYILELASEVADQEH